MDCPRCRESMEFGDGRWHCGDGTFLPGTRLDEHPRLARAIQKAPDQIPGPGCPGCPAVMFVTRVKGIDIDACRACRGVWLDADEERKLLAQKPTATVADAVIELLWWLPWLAW